MDEVLQYLQLKNQYYEKFYSVTSKFLENARQDKWEDLEFFLDNRERILNIIRSYDFKVAKSFEKVDPRKCNSPFYASRVKELLNRRTQLANKIVQLDLELMSRIDEVKTETIRELKRTVESGNQIETFAKAQPAPKPSKASRDA